MILVTGATGFLGSELVSQLISRGETVRALKRETSKIPEILTDKNNVSWFNADVLDYFSLKEAMQDVTHVYHCAAFISFDPADRKKMLQVNIQGTTNVINICLENAVQKLVHVSSVAAVGDGKPGKPVTEEEHLELNSGHGGYFVSKYESEMEVFRAIAEGLNAVVVNPSIIIGKNAGTEGSGQIFETVRKGMKYYPDGSNGFVDVEDVAKCMIKLMESNITGERFLINAETWSFYNLFSEVAVQLKLKTPSIALKPWMLKLAFYLSKLAGVFTGKNFGLTKDTIRSAFKKQDYDNSKIKTAINIQFKPIKQTIYEICNMIKTNTNLK